MGANVRTRDGVSKLLKEESHTVERKKIMVVGKRCVSVSDYDPQSENGKEA